MEGSLSLEIAEFLLNTFKGREDWIAFQPKGKHFSPYQLKNPITPQKFLESHLAQETCLGFYLLRPNNTVLCSALDFDNHNGSNPEAIQQGRDACLKLGQLGFNPLCEISQSGLGSHVWLIFKEEIPAWLVRLFWKTFIEKYVPNQNLEVYPKQDNLHDKKLGNLIRYPLFGKSKFIYYWTGTEDTLENFDIESVYATEDDLRRFLESEGVDTQSPSESVLEHPEACSDVLDMALPERVQILLNENPNTPLYSRWMCQTVGLVDGSYSGILMCLASEFVKNYIPTDEIREALTYWVHLRNYQKGIDRPDFIERTIDKAYEMVVDKREKKILTGNTISALVHQYVDAVYENEDVLIPTGIKGLDQSIGGMGFGELVVVSGRPSEGKTATAIQILDNASSFGFTGLLISLEMSAFENSKRFSARLVDQPVDWKTEQGNQYLHQKVETHFKNRSPIYFIDGTYDIARIEDAIDDYARNYGVQFVVVDYQGLATWDGSWDEYKAQTEITKRLKKAARRNDIVVLSLVQMKRVLNDNPDREPQLADLRSTGEIEQSADVIVFCRWPHFSDSSRPRNEYICWAKKCRNRGVKYPRIDLFFEPEIQTLR
jgi:replicative DNA helicase